MKNSNVKHRLSRLLGGLCGAALMFGLSACSDDLLLGTPEWLGTSIYEELESRGDYSVTLALINSSPVAADNYRELLSKTGSKTLFVADDAAWQRFFDKNKQLPAENPWSTITSTESFNASGNELKVRRLLKGMMLNNAYVLDLLGNLSSDPSTANVEDAADACMRRNTSISNLDMRGEVQKADFPAEKLPNASGVLDIDWWEDFRGMSAITTMPAVLNGADNTKPNGAAYLYTSNYGVPDLPTMVHFSPSFAVSKGFSGEDVSILSGGVANSTSQTVVNGVAIDPDNANITCQNGYIHKMVEVPYPVSNMMEKLSYEPQYSIFYKQLQRFSYPYKNQAQKDNLGVSDDVYTIRYINSGDYAGHCALTQDHDGKKEADAYLPYDPAWNHYYLAGGAYTYQMDAALMLVPRNDQMESFLTTEGQGAELTAKYAAGQTPSWDLYPDAIVAQLMQNCMLTNFLSFLPHNVNKIKDTSKTLIDGLDTDKIANCYVCGNGVIYGLSMNIVPPTYRDVTSTMLINKEKDKEESRDKGFSVFYNFIQKDRDIPGAAAGYASYLSSFDGTKYVLFCPYDKAMRKVIDPSSVKRNGGRLEDEKGPILFRFDYDGGRILPWIEPYGYTVDNDGVVNPDAKYGTLSRDDSFKSTTSPSTWYSSISYKMLCYIMENSVCPVYNLPAGANPLEPSYTYYKTKAGSAIKVDWDRGSTIKTAGYAGGYQAQFNRSVVSGESASLKANGAALPVDEVLLPATKSPYTVLKEEFPDFFKYVESNLKYTSSNDGNGHVILPSTDKAITLLRPYNYTIYVPTKRAIDMQVNSYQVPRSVWLDDIGSEENIKTTFPGISDDDIETIKTIRTKLDTALNRYLAYHVQDYAVFLGQRDTTAMFETSLLDEVNRLFYGLHVEEHSSTSSKTLKVYPKGYASRVVEVDPSKCNIQATQNFYDEIKDKTSGKGMDFGKIYSSAYAVIHQIANDEDLYMPPALNVWNKSIYDDMKIIFDRYGVALTDPVQN